LGEIYKKHENFLAGEQTEARGQTPPPASPLGMARIIYLFYVSYP